jgi:chemotaxis methyl-accepting protein methylase
VSIEHLESSFEARVGLRIDRTMRFRLQQQVREAARLRGMDAAQYAELVRRDETVRQSLVDTLVVPTTSFFRHPEHFDALRSLLGGWNGPVTVWSAGCSIGPEPYSIAMALHESGRKDWRVVASDVSSTAIERAASAVYEARELSGLSSERRQRYLERTGGRSRVVGELRERVTFVLHNLASDAVPRAALTAQAVFCRNVLIYLRPEVQRSFLERVVDHVTKLDIVFLGATESIFGVTERLVPVRVGAAYAYRRAGRRRDAAPSGEKATVSAPGRRAPAPSAPRAPAAGVRAPLRDSATYLADGHVALAAGEPAAAVTAFRRACYLDPENPLAHVNLGLSLDAAGHAAEARRAFATARATLRRGGMTLVEAELEGFRGEALVELIDRRLGHPG